MAAIEIVKSGIYTTVQDEGRIGYLKYGVSHSGYLDVIAAANANILAGNPPGTPLIECTYKAPALKFHEACVVGIAGASVEVMVNEQITSQQRIFVEKDDILKVVINRGVRCYIALGGGLKLATTLGSASVHGISQLGGKPKENGCTMELLHGETHLTNALVHPPDYSRIQIKVFPGPEFHRLTKKAKEKLFDQAFVVSSDSNRMACMLDGDPVPMKSYKMISSPVLPGTVQLPSDGKPMVLLNDCQTMGGYSRVLMVCPEAYPVLVQKRPGENITFQLAE